MNPRVLVIAGAAAAVTAYYLAFGGTNFLLDIALFGGFLGFACGIATASGKPQEETPHQALLREEAAWWQDRQLARKEKKP
ncbi:MAG: hypothetical protein GX625_21120 [Clostridiaceae bacterium]|jgi:hypothetical protein|nr:hypothetical protein [Clostridiaceae bacterium]